MINSEFHTTIKKQIKYLRMKNYPSIILKKGKEEAVKRFHPWIFSGAIQKIDKNISDGDIVNVYSAANEWLAIGHYSNSSISIRILSTTEKFVNQDFWNYKIFNACQARIQCGLINNISTNAYRLVFGEGDELPGLIIDIYNKTAVIQCHTIGMHNAINEIALAIESLPEIEIKCIYNKSSDTLNKQTGSVTFDNFIKGDNIEDIIKENNNNFKVNWVSGQKTGFFIDQRENRLLLSKYSKGKKILNAYCYSGGFSVYALNSGAEIVHSVDSSAKATELVKENLILNNFDINKHSVITEDVRAFLPKCEMYDIIILDPPAFAKHLSQKSQAIKGYKNINYNAIKKINRGGMLFTFSCSQAVDRDTFQNTVISAAIEAGRQCRIIHFLTQPADHPLNAFHREGTYLKGLVLKFD